MVNPGLRWHDGTPYWWQETNAQMSNGLSYSFFD